MGVRVGMAEGASVNEENENDGESLAREVTGILVAVCLAAACILTTATIFMRGEAHRSQISPYVAPAPAPQLYPTPYGTPWSK